MAFELTQQADGVISRRVASNTTNTTAAGLIAAMPVSPVDNEGRPTAGDSRSTGKLWMFSTSTATPQVRTTGDMNVNGSVTPVTFFAGPPAGYKWRCHKIDVTISDSSFDPLDFGGITGGIPNGLLLQLRYATGPTTSDLLPYSLRNNAEMSNLLAVPSNIEFGAVTKTISFIIDFLEYGGGHVWLDSAGDLGAERLQFVVQDNLSSIDYFRANLFYREYLRTW